MNLITGIAVIVLVSQVSSFAQAREINCLQEFHADSRERMRCEINKARDVSDCVRVTHKQNDRDRCYAKIARDRQECIRIDSSKWRQRCENKFGRY